MPHSFVVQMSLAQNRFLEGQKKSPLEPTELIVTVGISIYFWGAILTKLVIPLQAPSSV